MALSRNSKMKEIFANEEAYAILLKHLPGCRADDPRMGKAMGMPLKTLLSFPATKCPVEVREAIYAEIEAANLE